MVIGIYALSVKKVQNFKNDNVSNSEPFFVQNKLKP
jgi:hypothetical protein